MAHPLQIGRELAGIEKRITFDTMRRYSGDTGIHAQEDAGKVQGLGGALVQGGQLVAYLNQMMTDNFGERYLRGGEISVSFIKPVRPGDAVRARGVVQEIRAEGAKQRLVCEVWLENQTGEKTTVGTASVAMDEVRGPGE